MHVCVKKRRGGKSASRGLFLYTRRRVWAQSAYPSVSMTNAADEKSVSDPKPNLSNTRVALAPRRAEVNSGSDSCVRDECFWCIRCDPSKSVMRRQLGDVAEGVFMAAAA